MEIDPYPVRIVPKTGDKSFFGLQLNAGRIELHVPNFIDFSPGSAPPYDLVPTGEIKENMQLFLSLFRLLNREERIEGSANYFIKGHYCSIVDSFIWILRDYLSNGVPLRRELITRTNSSGRIRWKKTLQTQCPVLIDGNYIYANMVFSRKRPAEDTIIRAYRYCVNLASSSIGWLYSLSAPVFDEPAVSHSDICRYQDTVKGALAETFVDRRKQRLLHMDNILSNRNYAPVLFTQWFGSDSFHSIFEMLVKAVFGTEVPEKYYPKATAHVLRLNEDLSKLRPDCIMKTNSGLFVIDAKYYGYNLSQEKSDLPQSADVVKQIAYAEHIELAELNDGLPIYNVFILPSKSAEQLEYVGFVECSWCLEDNTYGRIHYVFIDLWSLICIWNSHNYSAIRQELSCLLEKNINSQCLLK